ncbi:MAG: SH3 domain-containing protein [Chloroflexi bacterium]|nr:SH3 domain-containing protein [Chloroflexota bacterium]
MMYPRNSWQRIALAIGLCVTLVAIMLVGINSTDTSLAQGDSTPIAVGDVVEGQLGEDGTATYTFTAQAGDVVQISVFALDFVPTVEVQAASTPIAVREQFFFSGRVAELTYLVLSEAEQSIEIRGQNTTTGQFTLSLTQVEFDLPEGTTLTSGQVQRAELATAEPAIFRFSGDEGSPLELSIRSRTDDFQPHVFLMTASGEFMAEVSSPYLSNVAFTIEAGIRDYILIVTRGAFVDVASVDVGLSGGGIGLVEVPDDTCHITASTRINVRAGASTEHGIVDVMGAERFLKVIATDPTTTWYQVQLPDGRSGWVSSEVVALIGNCEGLPQVESPPLPTAEDGGEGEPTMEPTTEATVEPTPEGTVEPTVEITPVPTVMPTFGSTEERTPEPTPENGTPEPTATTS